MARPPVPQRLTIPGPAGALEAVVEIPDSAAAGAFAAICHPHPLHGGTLDNKVVHTLARTFQGLAAPTVRFNFRGVGGSAGSFAAGEGESEDAKAVVAWGHQRWPGAALWLAGFSFGGAIAIRIAAAVRPQLLVTAAPAVHRVDLTELQAPACPWLIVQGDADEVVSHLDVQSWIAEHARGAELAVLPGVSHFFHGRLHELQDVVSAFAARHQKKSPAGN